MLLPGWFAGGSGRDTLAESRAERFDADGGGVRRRCARWEEGEAGAEERGEEEEQGDKAGGEELTCECDWCSG